MFCDEGGVIELELLHRIFELRVFIRIDGIDTREDIRSDPLESLDRMLGLGRSGKNSITDTRFGDGFKARDDVTDLALIEDSCGRILRTKTPDFECFDLGSGVDEFELGSLLDLSTKQLQVHNNSLVGVVL